MIAPLRSRPTNSRIIILPSTTTATINERIGNLKISKNNNENIEEDLNLKFRSKIPIIKSRLNCGTILDNDNGKCIDKKNGLKLNTNIQQQQQRQDKEQQEIKKKSLIENIDNESDCFLLSDYAADIYKYLHKLEKSLSLKTNFLSNNNYINNNGNNGIVTPNMRSLLLNWINGIHRSFHLVPETLYLSISIVDRVLSREYIEKSKLQLLGATAIFIAAKYEEMYYPDIKDFVTICDNLYTKNDIIKMEIRILKITNFELNYPSPIYFLRRASKAAHADSRVHMMGKYLCELSIMDYQCSQWLPSLIAATSLYVALKLNYNKDGNEKPEHQKQQQPIWNATIEHYTGYTVEDVTKHAAKLCRLIISNETSKYQNCRKKYSSQKFMSISNLSPDSMRVVKKMAV